MVVVSQPGPQGVADIYFQLASCLLAGEDTGLEPLPEEKLRDTLTFPGRPLSNRSLLPGGTLVSEG